MTRALRVLFVCTQNKLRSPTAERVFAGHADLEVASAGIHPRAEEQISRDLLDWADVVICMEKHHRDYVRRIFTGVGTDERILVLGIPDEYDFMDPALVRLLERLVPRRLEKFRRTLERKP